MNSSTVILFLAALPVIIILIYVYSKDKNKEPIGLLLQLFGLGILSCFIVLFVSNILEPLLPFMQGNLSDKTFIDILLYSFIGVALIEELSKWIILYFKGYKNESFDEVYDILVYSIFVSLGFAFFENVIYIVGTGSLLTAILRAFSAIPGHACDAIFMGYYLNFAKQASINNNKVLEKKNIILSILIPSILHGIYDFCLMSGKSFLVLLFIVFIIYLYSISLKRLKEMSKNNKTIKKKNKYCPVCGAKVDDLYCGNCGTKQE